MPDSGPATQLPILSKWRHYRPSNIYDKNYGFGINYYQPMIDYIDRKENGESDAPKPELPWSDARGVWENSHVIPYTKDELAYHALNAEMKAKDHLENFKVQG